MKVAKFGGSSLADGDQILKVAEIIKTDPTRTCIVVSAPGKRFPEDHKITDLLYEWQRLQSLRLNTREIYDLIYRRYVSICQYFFTDYRILDEDFEKISIDIEAGASPDYAASRGEYLSAKLVAKVLDCRFVDATEIISFQSETSVEVVSGTVAAYVESETIVVPGFYGIRPDMSIKTFSRGGSDVTGALLAQALKASVYENWTDVSGMLMADPRIVKNPKAIETLSYRELRELSYMGASVFHEEAMFPVVAASIPTNIRNTNEPDNGGTLIVPEMSVELAPDIITGVAGRKGFSVIKVEKTLMNQEVGFMRRLLSILEENNLSIEHVPSSVDSVSVIVATSDLVDRQQSIIADIYRRCQPDLVQIEHGLSLIAIVGRRMTHTVGVAAKASTALAEAGVNLRVINQGSSEINIIIGVDEADFETAVRAIYAAFVTS